MCDGQIDGWKEREKKKGKERGGGREEDYHRFNIQTPKGSNRKLIDLWPLFCRIPSL